MKCPHGCINKEFDFYDCITDPGNLPEEGSVGMCYHCGGWWELKNGKAIVFEPDDELLQLVVPQAEASHQRAKARWSNL